MILGGNNTEDACSDRRIAVATRLPLHEDEFNVILNDGVWFIRLSEKARTPLHLIGSVGDLMPDNWGEVIKP
jgi:hypothetical protein